MNKKIKVAISILIILFGVVTLIFFLKTKPEQAQFKLINQVSESDIAYHTNLIDILDDVIQYNSDVEKSLTNKVALNRLKDQLLNSGLKNGHVFITHSFENSGLTSLYAEIIDTAKFEATFKELSSLLQLLPVQDSVGYFLSSNKKLSAQKSTHFVRLNFGRDLDKTPHKASKPSHFFTELLKKDHFGVINTTGTAHIDSTDYATFSYNFDKELVLDINWTVEENHPIRKNKSELIQVYPTEKEALKIIAHLDVEYLIENLNPYLKNLGATQFNKLPKAAKEIFKLWDGQASVQMGGKTGKESYEIVTEFDDDFNQIERKITTIDSLLNLGVFWSTKNPAQTFSLLHELPNVEIQNNELQIALLPSLVTKTEDKSAKASTQSIDFEQLEPQNIFLINTSIEGLKGNLSIQYKNQKTIQFQFILEDWKGLSNPKELDFSSFW